MKSLNYTISLFRKAVRRNNPTNIHLVFTPYVIRPCEYWFVTQKASITCLCNPKESRYINEFLEEIGYKSKRLMESWEFYKDGK